MWCLWEGEDGESERETNWLAIWQGWTGGSGANKFDATEYWKQTVEADGKSAGGGDVVQVEDAKLTVGVIWEKVARTGLSTVGGR